MAPPVSPISWQCPHCRQHATLREHDYSESVHALEIDCADNYLTLKTLFCVCPNSRCRKVSLTASLFHTSAHPRYQQWRRKKTWSLVPDHQGRPLPEYVPRAVRDTYDYAWACRDVCPPAAAALARKTLELLIASKWNIKKKSLNDQIDAITDKISPQLQSAIDSVRRVGNIAIHLSKTPEFITEIEPNEAELLLQIIDMCIDQWYIFEHVANQRVDEVNQLAAKKEAEHTGENGDETQG